MRDPSLKRTSDYATREVTGVSLCREQARMTAAPQQIGRAIRNNRCAQSLNQTQLAIRAGTLQSAISKFENGHPGTHRTLARDLTAMVKDLV